ncbi:hypothetical protein FHS29_006984 [Saccharothrix tamanrassetensis]|uniref:Uncharacterized protein n=1 Tax=Saccharothrix tamanrassetensis TaxID=1051531 RepID=A0A841CRJ9_9PSEU|nr:hypothetical protein [Saccharothrix tamanrassetensis]
MIGAGRSRARRPATACPPDRRSTGRSRWGGGRFGWGSTGCASARTIHQCRYSRALFPKSSSGRPGRLGTGTPQADVAHGGIKNQVEACDPASGSARRDHRFRTHQRLPHQQPRHEDGALQAVASGRSAATQGRPAGKSSASRVHPYPEVYCQFIPTGRCARCGGSGEPSAQLMLLPKRTHDLRDRRPRRAGQSAAARRARGDRCVDAGGVHARRGIPRARQFTAQVVPCNVQPFLTARGG